MSGALVVQHEKHMCRIILSILVHLTILYFSTLCHKWEDFRENPVIEHEICISIFSTGLSKLFVTIITILGDIILNVHSQSSHKVPVIVVIF